MTTEQGSDENGSARGDDGSGTKRQSSRKKILSSSSSSLSSSSAKDEENPAEVEEKETKRRKEGEDSTNDESKKRKPITKIEKDRIERDSMIDSFRKGGKAKDNLLWVKVKSFPEWPARFASKEEIKAINATLESDQDLVVYFFGTGEYTVVKPGQIHGLFDPSDSETQKKGKKSKSKVFVEGFKAATEWFKTPVDSRVIIVPHAKQQPKGKGKHETKEANNQKEEENDKTPQQKKKENAKQKKEEKKEESTPKKAPPAQKKRKRSEEEKDPPKPIKKLTPKEEARREWRRSIMRKLGLWPPQE